ncbi:hypothetical protein KUCAC02_004489, partial [Chaenocephalus aceratus]
LSLKPGCDHMWIYRLWTSDLESLSGQNMTPYGARQDPHCMYSSLGVQMRILTNCDVWDI